MCHHSTSLHQSHRLGKRTNCLLTCLAAGMPTSPFRRAIIFVDNGMPCLHPRICPAILSRPCMYEFFEGTPCACILRTAGADIVLGMLPLARELLRCGSEVRKFRSHPSLLSVQRMMQLSNQIPHGLTLPGANRRWCLRLMRCQPSTTSPPMSCAPSLARLLLWTPSFR